jgi:hypothetical protein
MNVGEKIRVRYEDGFKYTLEVKVTALCPSNEFIGRVERVFAVGDGEIEGGDILALKGQEKAFKKEDIVPAAH